MNSFIQK